MAVINRVEAVELFAINSATLGGAYQAINAAGFPHPCFLIRIINDSDESVLISYDGVTDHDYIAMNGTLQLPAQANSQPNNFTALFAQGMRVYVRGVAGTGTINLAGYFLKSAA